MAVGIGCCQVSATVGLEPSGPKSVEAYTALRSKRLCRAGAGRRQACKAGWKKVRVASLWRLMNLGVVPSTNISNTTIQLIPSNNCSAYALRARARSA